jgi:hypothetical protein
LTMPNGNSSKAIFKWCLEIATSLSPAAGENVFCGFHDSNGIRALPDVWVGCGVSANNIQDLLTRENKLRRHTVKRRSAFRLQFNIRDSHSAFNLRQTKKDQLPGVCIALIISREQICGTNELRLGRESLC